MKDSMILSFGGGFKAVPFLKIVAILFILFLSFIYNVISNKCSIKTIFISFFILSSIMLYVFSFHLLENYINLDRILHSPEEIVWIMWPVSLFYILADFWVVASGSLIFWKMLNTSFNNQQAKNNYSFFITMGNIGMIISGSIGITLAHSFKGDITLIQNISALLIILMLIAASIVYNIESYGLTQMRQEHMSEKETFVKISTWEKLKTIFLSGYFIKMFLIVFIASSINVIADHPVKQLIEEVFTNIGYQIQFLSSLNILMGIFAISVNIQNATLFHKIGWVKSSLIAPIGIGGINIIFCILLYFKQLVLIKALLIFATLQFVVSKGIKFSIFTFTFEMLFIPLNLETQKKGKIAISVIASRIGKSFGSMILIYIQQFNLFLIINASIIFILCTIWCILLFKIHTSYIKLIKQENKELQ